MIFIKVSENESAVLALKQFKYEWNKNNILFSKKRKEFYDRPAKKIQAKKINAIKRKIFLKQKMLRNKNKNLLLSKNTTETIKVIEDINKKI